MALLLKLLSIIPSSTFPHIRNLRVQQLSERDAKGIDTLPTVTWDFHLSNSGANVDASFSVAAYTIFVGTSNGLVAAAIREVEENKFSSAMPQSSSLYYVHRTVEHSQQSAFSSRLPETFPLESSSRYSWAVCAQWQDNGGKAGGSSCSRVHSFVTGIIASSPHGSEWTARWIGGNTSTTPKPCNPCMASYHAWCKEVHAPPCMFRGVKMRGPDQKLLAKPIESAVIHATGVGMFALRLNGLPVTDARMEPGTSILFICPLPGYLMTTFLSNLDFCANNTNCVVLHSKRLSQTIPSLRHVNISISCHLFLQPPPPP